VIKGWEELKNKEHGVKGMRRGERKKWDDTIKGLTRLAQDPRVVGDEDRMKIMSHLDKAEQEDDLHRSQQHYISAYKLYSKSGRSPGFWQGLWNAMRRGGRRGVEWHKTHWKE